MSDTGPIRRHDIAATEAPPRDDEIIAGLAALGSPAPHDVALGALVRVGLADAWAELPSPLGAIGIAWNGRGISWLDRADDAARFQDRFAEHVGRPLRRTEQVPERMAMAVAARLAGNRRIRIPLDLRGHTPFEVAVWLKALEIPRGEVRPYGWIAAEIGHPKAVRAVGTALSHNPVPLVVPCHRVVRSDGTIGQYSLGGPEAKRTVLETEGLDTVALEAQARSGLRYLGSATTGVVCLPTCHHARRIGAPHRRPFRSLASAVQAGYRPCRSCRPDSGSAIAA
ncbi:MAG: methylated-DNA--[protein]-cysteine S-methyltransferase [Chloroflexi bacterium]|nr:methylated-DNA--[protein]-cysteine S-methyltransferase [Chloroflexota bacterium]